MVLSKKVSRLSLFEKFFSDGASGHTVTQAIPDNILAFRMITTLLQKVQQQSFTITEEEPGSSESDQKELQISTAFSTVAVINHEVVAVATSLLPKKLKVIVSTNSRDEDQPIIQP